MAGVPMATYGRIASRRLVEMVPVRSRLRSLRAQRRGTGVHRNPGSRRLSTTASTLASPSVAGPNLGAGGTIDLCPRPAMGLTIVAGEKFQARHRSRRELPARMVGIFSGDTAGPGGELVRELGGWMPVDSPSRPRRAFAATTGWTADPHEKGDGRVPSPFPLPAAHVDCSARGWDAARGPTATSARPCTRRVRPAGCGSSPPARRATTHAGGAASAPASRRWPGCGATFGPRGRCTRAPPPCCTC